LPQKDIRRFIEQLVVGEKLDITGETIEKIQQMYQSDIRSMINFIQLNATSFQPDGYGKLIQSKIVRGENWRQLHDLLASNVGEDGVFGAEKYIHYISVHFNIDKRNILNMYFNYVLRTYPEIVNEAWLTIAENVVHTTDDVEIKHVLSYFCVNLSEYYQTRLATSSSVGIAVR
jgi:DNA polymerase III delta prime subunit